MEKEGGKIGIGKFRTAAVEKNRTLGSFAPAQAATEKKGMFIKGGGGGGGGYGGGHSFNGVFKGPTLHTPAGKGNPPFSFHLFEGDTVPPLSLPSFQGWFLFTSCTFSLVIPHLC